MIISQHIPKTAGTSLLKMLKNSYGDRLLQHNENPEYTYQTSFKDLSQKFDVVHGHIDLHRAEHLLYNRTFFFSFLRDPVQRVLSSYCFHSRPEANNELAKHVRDSQMTVREFADMPSQRNLQHNMLRIIGRENVDFFGFVEDFAASTQRLSSVLGLAPFSDTYSNVNPEKSVQDSYDTDADLNAFIFERNQLDQDLYYWAQDNF